MAWYPDLAKYEYLPDSVPEGEAMLTVGWLSSKQEFPVGDVPEAFTDELSRICASVDYARTRGFHECMMNHPDGEISYPMKITVNGNSFVLGNAEIRVVSEAGTVLSAPNLVWHYVTAHRYRPPGEFVEAVCAHRLAPADWGAAPTIPV